jgi:spore coat-associated protein S
VIFLDYQGQEPLVQVLSNYDLKVTNIRNETFKEKKGVWWVETSSGLKVLKKISNSEQTLKYIISAIRHLAKNGINLAEIIRTKSRDDYVNINGTCYMLTEAIQGKSPSYDTEKELSMIIKELARFHKASAGFEVLPGTKPKIHLGTWVEDYTGQIEDMNTFYIKEVSVNGSVNGQNAIGKLIVQEFPYFDSRARSAIEKLKGAEYRNWTEKAMKTGALCHQDFAAGNLILNPSGKLYVLDTDSITLDIPARDIRKILCKVMKRIGKWDLELTKRIISDYQSINPLEPSEWKIVLYDVMFPHLFIGAMNKYYYKRDKEWSEDKYFRRIREMADFEKTITPVLNNFNSIIPK